MFSKLKTLSRVTEAKNPTARFDRDGNIVIRVRSDNEWRNAVVETQWAADVFQLQQGWEFWVANGERKQQRFLLAPIDQDVPEKPQEDAREIQLLPIYSAELKKLTTVSNRADLIFDERRTSEALVKLCTLLEGGKEFAQAVEDGMIPICQIAEAEDTEFGMQPSIAITDFVDRPKSMGAKLLTA